MSGPLPEVLYKYLPLKHATSMVARGELMVSSLAWFQSMEDHERGDEHEGIRKYFPASGLDVTRLERGGQPHGPVTSKLLNHSFLSRAKGRNHIFIFSTTLTRGLTFNEADACVEIHDTETFTMKLQAALARRSRVEGETLIHDGVSYYDFSQPPENVWALPHLLATYKEKAFAHQQEYRFAFGIRRNVFALEYVDCVALRDGERIPRKETNPAHHRRIVRLGSLNDCCRVLSTGD